MSVCTYITNIIEMCYLYKLYIGYVTHEWMSLTCIGLIFNVSVYTMYVQISLALRK